MKGNRDSYLSFHAQAVRPWLNECWACHHVGHKPEMPQRIGDGALASYLRQFFEPLALNEQGLCEQCEWALANRASGGITDA